MSHDRGPLPGVLLRLEGLALAAFGIFVFNEAGEPWWLLAALFLAPDLSMVGYLAGSKVGSWSYNLVHFELWPLALLMYAVSDRHPLVAAIAGVWLLHIGVDRLIGYGFKYETDFKDTHLQHV